MFGINQEYVSFLRKFDYSWYNLSGCWSRRITKADRLIYEVQGEKIIVHSLRGHY